MSSTRTSRILLVDDEWVNLRVLKAVLESAGYTNLVTIADPHQVLTEHQSEAADLVLLDLTMPALDGFAVMEQLYSNGGTTRPPAVVVITGHTDQDVIERAHRAGAAGYVTKPFDMAKLLAAVETALGENSHPPSDGAPS